MRVKFDFYGAFLLGLAGCGTGASGREHGSGERCASECESRIWSRVVIASSLSQDAGVEVSVVGEATPPYQVMRNLGCRDFPPAYDCEESFSLFAGPALDHDVEISATSSGEQAATVVEIRGDACGHDIAYVRLFAQDGGLAFEPARYISPCSIPSL